MSKTPIFVNSIFGRANSIASICSKFKNNSARIRTPRLCLLLVLFILSLQGVGQDYSEIRVLLSAGDNEDARTIIESEIEGNRNLSELYFLYSLSFIEHVDTLRKVVSLDSYDSIGLAFLDKSLEINPGFNEALLKRAILNSRKSRYLESKEDLIKIYKSKETYPWETNFYLAIAEANTGTEPENKLMAIEILQSSHPKTDYDKFRLHRLMGIYYSDLLNHGAAILSYSSALKLVPNDVDLLESRGDEKLASGNVYGAILDLRHSLKLFMQDQNGDESYINRFAYRINMKIGRILLDTQKFTESIEHYEKSINHQQFSLSVK